MSHRFCLRGAVALGLCALWLSLAGPAVAQNNAAAAKPAAKPASGAAEAVPKFDAAYMRSVANIKAGEKVWAGQCRHCHGNSAYPGKAPKLNPGAMQPDFIFDRVTNGFQKMPAWKEVFSLNERKAVVAYVKSNDFMP